MVVQLRLVLVAVAALCAMGAFSTGVLARSHVGTAGCSLVHIDNNAPLTSCHRGLLAGYPNLLHKGCTAVGTMGRNQLWSCPKS